MTYELRLLSQILHAWHNVSSDKVILPNAHFGLYVSGQWFFGFPLFMITSAPLQNSVPLTPVHPTTPNHRADARNVKTTYNNIIIYKSGATGVTGEGTISERERVRKRNRGRESNN